MLGPRPAAALRPAAGAAPPDGRGRHSGNPLYALELAAAQRRSGRLRGDLPASPGRLEELLADRLGRLPSEATESLAAVAGLAAPTVTLITAMLGEPARAGLKDSRAGLWVMPSSGVRPEQ